MATERLRTVKVAGGDYSSASGWEAGENADIVAADEIRTAEVYSMTDTTAVTFAGWTTDATRYAKVYTPTTERHAGVWTTGKQILSVTNAHPMTVQMNNIRFIGLQIEVTETGATAPRIGVLVDSQTGSTCAIVMDKCILRKGSGTTNGTVHGIRVNAASAKFYMTNSLVYNFDQASARGFDLQTTGGDVWIYNCGFYNCTQGIRDTYGTISNAHLTVKNTWTQACTDGFDTLGSGWGTGTDYNLSSGAGDAPGANSKNSTTISFVDATNRDLHLASGDTGAKDSGTDLSADSAWPFSDDIDGSTRSGTWDIGPDEYVAGGGGGLPFFLQSDVLHGYIGQLSGGFQ